MLTAGEHEMKLMALGLVVGCVCLPSLGHAQAGPWTSAKLPGEQNRAVQGCANDPQKAGDWLCIFVRCDQPGSPVSLYFSAMGSDIQGNIELVVDEDAFPVSVPGSGKSALPLSTRAGGVPNGLLDAMKAGRTLSIQGSYLQPPHNQISLENSRKAIESVERACTRPYPGPAAFWRRISRSVGFY
jgi:hypothetical protein